MGFGFRTINEAGLAYLEVRCHIGSLAILIMA